MDAKDIRNIQEAYLSVYQEIDEVKGYGGHVDPNTGKSSGLRSPSQQAHATHWRNRQQGKDVSDPRRSTFKYGGSKGSTTGAHQGEPPEDFAKKQDPDLAMTPAARMKARARALELKGEGKRANKIRSVMNRPSMQQESYEELQIASEYFYEMGLNEYGIDILIEELGEDDFVDWVDEIVEETYLEEASQTRLQKMADKKNKILIGPKGSRPQSTTKAAIKKYGGTVRGGISGGVSGVIKKREGAAKIAKETQPASSSTPTQTQMGMAGRIGSALGGFVKRAKQDIETTRKTAQTVGKAVRTGIDALNTASDSRLARQARVVTKKGFQRQQRAINTLAPVVGRAAGRAAANVPAIRDTYKAGQKLGRALRGEEYDYILSHLLDEGYANNLENAEVILMNMSESWVDDILDEAQQIMSVSGKGGLKHMINPTVLKLQNAASRERQQRQAREKAAKEAANAARYDQALRKGINRATNRSEPQDQYAGYGEIEALSPRADGGAHSGRKRLARRASGR